jgi:hypothetical protein
MRREIREDDIEDDERTRTCVVNTYDSQACRAYLRVIRRDYFREYFRELPP